MSAGLGANERSKLKGLSHKGKKLKNKLQVQNVSASDEDSKK